MVKLKYGALKEDAQHPVDNESKRLQGMESILNVARSGFRRHESGKAVRVLRNLYRGRLWYTRGWR